MRSLLILAAAGALGVAVGTTAQAGVAVGIDPNGDGAGIMTFDQLDWAAGNALAVDSTNIAVGSTFDVYYQARLAQFNYNDPLNPSSYSFTNLSNTNFEEWTVVAGFKEKVTGLTVNGTTVNATFNLIGGGPDYFEIYYDSNNVVGGSRSNDLLGTGFNNGTLVLSGTIANLLTSNFNIPDVTQTALLDQSLGDNWAGTRSVIGSGSTSQVLIDVGYLNPLFFTGPLDVLTFVLDFSTGQQAPFPSVNPGQKIVDAPGGVAPTRTPDLTPAAETIYGGTTKVNGAISTSGNNFDTMLEIDARNNFNVVPEPGTMILLGSGLLGLAGAARRRGKKES